MLEPNTALLTGLNFAKALISIYTILIIIRIFLTWFGQFSQGRPAEVLARITDPYLNLFRGIPWLRLGMLDLSPIAALILLNMVSSVINSVIYTGTFSLGIVLAILVGGVWSAVRFIFQLIFFLAAARIVASRFFHSQHFFWQTLDSLFMPLVDRMNRIKRRGNDFEAYKKDFPYQTGLMVLAGFSLVIMILGSYLALLLQQFLYTLPF